MKKFLIIFWNIISTIILLILKGIACIIVFPLEAINDFFSIIRVVIKVICYILAFLLLLIMFDSLTEPIGFAMTAITFLFLLVFPLSLKTLTKIIDEYVVIFLKDFISDTPLTAWSIQNTSNQAEDFNDFEGEDYDDSYEEETPKYTEETSGFDVQNLFDGITDKNSLKKRYHDLLKIYHPDNLNGDTTMSQKIQNAYEQLLSQNNW